MRCISLFSGIGGFERGLQHAANRFTCFGFSEIDRHAIHIYQKHFPGHTSLGDITAIDAQTLPRLICLSVDFLVRHLASPKSAADFPIREALFLKSHGYSNTKGLACFSLKMSKASSATTAVQPSPQSSERLLSWGMICNGKCLTARITESLRTGSACSLLDILEEHPDQKYFLSDKMVKGLMKPSPRFQGTFKTSDLNGTSPTLTARYWKMGSTDPYNNSTRLPIPTTGSTAQTAFVQPLTRCKEA